MLTIRAEQMAVLDDVPLVPWLVQLLRTLFPESAGGADDSMLIAMVRRSVARGRSLGFARDDLAAWVALEHVFGESFHELPEHAWARKLLDQHGAEPARAVQSLREQAVLRLSGAVTDVASDEASVHG